MDTVPDTHDTASGYLRKVRLNATQKARAFLSSRMSYKLGKEELTVVRKELKAVLEAAFPYLSVELAEDWTGGRKRSPKDLSRKGGASSDLFLVILVDSAGHQDDAGLGATEIEVLGAVQDSWDKVLVFVQKGLGKKLAGQPPGYRKLVKLLMDYESGKNVTEFSNREELFAGVIGAVAGHSAVALKRFSSRVSGKSPAHTRWELMTFTERFEKLQETFQNEAKDLTGIPAIRKLAFDRKHDGHRLYGLSLAVKGKPKLPVIVSACPDRFSFPEAARFVGYPFRTLTEAWEDMVAKWRVKAGPIHIVLIYRTITDTQIRRHLGNPDIRVAREPWGYFARDPERFIQCLYLVNCQDPVSIHERLHEGLGWLADDRLPVIVSRAKGRGKIIEARRQSGD